MRAKLAAVVAVLAFWCACRTGSGVDDLQVSLSPTTVTGSEISTVGITATNADGAPGSGSVEVSSSTGTLATPVTLTLDSTGAAQTTLAAPPVADTCATSVKVTAKWTPKSGTPLTAVASLKVLTPGYDAGSSTLNAISPIDPVCSTDAGLMTFYPDAGPLIANDVPADCANGFEINNARNQTIYALSSKTTAGSRAIVLDVDLATYKVPDRVRITGVDSCDQPYLLLSSCELQTANVGDPTSGSVRPPNDTIRQFRLSVPRGTKQLAFDFSGVTSPMYLRVLGLCDFNVVSYADAFRWQAVP